MKARIKKTAAGSVPPSPVPHRPWQESVDDFDLHLSDIVDQESEEAVVDLWLEDPLSFGVTPFLRSLPDVQSETLLENALRLPGPDPL